MAQIRIQITFDYVDPGSYLAHALLERWVPTGGDAPSTTWHPLELRPPPSAPIDPEDPKWAALTDAMRAEAGEEEVPFVRPLIVPWTRKAHELAFHARANERFEAVHRSLFAAHFQEGRDIGRVDVLVEIGSEHGLEAAETRTVLGVDRFLPEVERARSEARGRSLRGVPILEAGGRRLEGMESAETLRAFLRELADGPDGAAPGG